MLLCDFHIHTRWSDGVLELREAVDLYGQNGFDCIAITDHLCETNSFLGVAAKLLAKTLDQDTLPHYHQALEEEAQRAWDQYRMIVLPGVEVTKNHIGARGSAHFLAINHRKPLDPNKSVEDLLIQIRNEGGTSVAAHTVSTRLKEHQTFYLWDHRRELEGLFDLWEVASGKFLFDEILSTPYNKVASSDLHRPDQINAWKTLVRAEKHPEAILRALKRQETQFHYFNTKLENWGLAKDFKRKQNLHPLSPHVAY